MTSDLTIWLSYGLSLADGDDSMDETEQVSKQILMREGKVYDKWDQLYPALLHLSVNPTLFPCDHPAILMILSTATANQITLLFGMIPGTQTDHDGDPS